MGEYVDIGAVRMWYETSGDGEPLVLLHGGLEGNDAWGAQLDALAEHFRVVAPEQRGHGHTPDVEGPLSYRVLAADATGFLDAVVGGPAHLVGWSDGAILGLIIARERPDLVRRLVLIGGNADRAGYVPEFEQITQLPADSSLYAPTRAAHAAVSPDGAGHWPVLYAKVVRMWQTEPQIPLADLASVAARTLVLVGDDDVVTLEHTVALYRALPDAELCVVPGTSHAAPIERPEHVNRVLLDFLCRDAVPTLLPIRRPPSP